MKRNILARRAASAALAACMMFTLSAPALAASTDALLQQSTAAKSAVSALDEENGTEVETEYQMNLKYGSIRVYIEDNGKQYVQQGDNEAQQRGNLYITTDGGRTTNTLTIEGGTIGAKVTLSNVNIETTSDAAVSVWMPVLMIIQYWYSVPTMVAVRRPSLMNYRKRGIIRVIFIAGIKPTCLTAVTVSLVL